MISPEEWQLITSKCDDDQSHLMTPKERFSFLQKHISEEERAKIYDIRSTQGGRKKRHVTAQTLEWDNVDTYARTPSGRSLEDLVLECIENNIDLNLYLS